MHSRGWTCPITLAGANSYVCDQDYRIASNIPGADVLTNGAVDPDVKPYRQSEYTFEFQREVMRATVLTARYLYRNLDETIEDAGVPRPQAKHMSLVTLAKAWLPVSTNS